LTCAICSPFLKYLFHKSLFTGSCIPYVESAVPYCSRLQHRLWKWLDTDELADSKTENRTNLF